MVHITFKYRDGNPKGRFSVGLTETLKAAMDRFRIGAGKEAGTVAFFLVWDRSSHEVVSTDKAGFLGVEEDGEVTIEMRDKVSF
jgi:hypothetical protein